MPKKIQGVSNRVIAVNELPLRDRDVPEIYADLCANIHSFNGNVVFTVATCRLRLCNPNDGPAERVVSGRLIMPLGAVVDLHRQLGMVLQDITQAETTVPNGAT